MFSSFLKYFANATHSYVKTGMVYSFLFHSSRHSHPEDLTVVSAYIIILVPRGIQTNNHSIGRTILHQLIHIITNHLMSECTSFCIVFLHVDGTSTNLDDQPMYNTIMYKWFVRMVN
jgi:hypothetical protein